MVWARGTAVGLLLLLLLMVATTIKAFAENRRPGQSVLVARSRRTALSRFVPSRATRHYQQQLFTACVCRDVGFDARVSFQRRLISVVLFTFFLAT